MMLAGVLNARGLAGSCNVGGDARDASEMVTPDYDAPPAFRLPTINAGPPGQAHRLCGVREVVREEKGRIGGRGGADGRAGA